MSRKIEIEILADSSKFSAATDKAGNSSEQLESTWDKLQKSAEDLSTSMGTLAEKMDPDAAGLENYADAFGSLEQTLTGVSDVLGVAAEQFGISLGPMQEYAGAAAQVAGGMEGIISGGAGLVKSIGPIVSSMPALISSTWAHVSALLAQAAAFIVANAPMLLIIGSIALLAAGVVLLVKNWDTIQPHVQPVIDFFDSKVVPAFEAVWEKGLKPVIDFVTNNWKLIGTLILAPFAPIILIATDAFGIRSKMEAAFNAMLDFVRDTWKGVKDFVTKPFDDILEAAKGAFGVKAAIIGAFTAIPAAITGAFAGLGSVIDGLLAPIISTYNAIASKVPGMSTIGGGGGSSAPASTARNPMEPGYESTRSNLLIGEVSPSGGAQPGYRYATVADIPNYDSSKPKGVDQYYPSVGDLLDGKGHWWNEATQSWYNIGGGRYLDPSKWAGSDPVGNDVIDARNLSSNKESQGITIVMNNVNMRSEAEATRVLTNAARAAGLI